MNATDLKIFIVEDEVVIALDLEYMFSSLGAEVTLAHSLEEGLAKCDASYDVAVLDVRLRGTEVFPVARELQAHDVPIVFHSAHTRYADVVVQFPGARVISKPAREDELIGLVLEAAA